MSATKQPPPDMGAPIAALAGYVAFGHSLAQGDAARRQAQSDVHAMLFALHERIAVLEAAAREERHER